MYNTVRCDINVQLGWTKPSTHARGFLHGFLFSKVLTRGYWRPFPQQSWFLNKLTASHKSVKSIAGVVNQLRTGRWAGRKYNHERVVSLGFVRTGQGKCAALRVGFASVGSMGHPDRGSFACDVPVDRLSYCHGFTKIPYSLFFWDHLVGSTFSARIRCQSPICRNGCVVHRCIYSDIVS